VNAVSEELRNRLPKLFANVAIAMVFLTMSFIALWTLSGISTDIVFLSQIGLLLAAGLFLVRSLFDALMIIDKATGLFVRRLGINDGCSRQRIFKDTVYVVAILLVAAAIFPLFTRLPNYGSLLQELTTYAALGLLLLFVYDIGRTFYRITENKANSVANRISSSINEDATTNGK
jgi:hypothetical protein